MPAPHLSQSVRAGNLVFTSGQLAFENSQIKGDIGVQTRAAIENLRSVLACNGLDLGAIIKTTVWLTWAADFQLFDEVYAEMFGEHKPARSTTICELAIPEALVEIEAIAMCPV